MYRGVIGNELAQRAIEHARRTRRIVYVGLADGDWQFVPQKEALFACMWTGRGHVIPTRRGTEWLKRNPQILPSPQGTSDPADRTAVA